MRVEKTGSIVCLNLLVVVHVQPRIWLDFWARSAHCWVLSNILPTSIPGSLATGTSGQRKSLNSLCTECQSCTQHERGCGAAPHAQSTPNQHSPSAEARSPTVS